MPLKIYEHLVVGDLACNCYIVGDDVTKQAILIDPGDEPEAILEALRRHELQLTAIVATHAHFDHVLAAEAIRTATGAPFYLHKDDKELLEWLPASMRLFLGVDAAAAPEVDRPLQDGDELVAGGLKLAVIHTPGHSPGSISLLAQDEAVFSGDTLFADSIGRTDLPGGDYEAIIASIRKRLFALGDLPVYPGHGPATSTGRERLTNPFAGLTR